jgi:Cephalosporin hydroxylase
VIEDLPEDFYPQHPWNVGNNPKTAVWDFLAQNDCFEIDRSIPEKLLITVAPDGFSQTEQLHGCAVAPVATTLGKAAKRTTCHTHIDRVGRILMSNDD